MMFVFSCEDAIDFSTLLRDSFDTSAMTKAMAIPTAPESIASGSSARALSAASGNEADGVVWGNFIFAHQASSNYNSALNNVSYYVDLMANSSENIVETTAQAPFTKRFSGSDGDGGSFSFYTNDDGSRTSYVMYLGADSYNSGEVRQIDFERRENYNFGRAIFYRLVANDMVDVTEVWEYNDHKEVSTSRRYNLSTSTYNDVQFIGIAETTSSSEKCSMLVGYNVPLLDYEARAQEINIGVIDLTMMTVQQSRLLEDYNSIPAGFPAVGNLLDLAKIVIVPSQIVRGMLSYTNTDRYAGFDE